jgi:hypothetical protein
LANIFVSYARGDRERIMPLVSALEAEGLSVWWDPALVPGRRFRQMIAEELAAADAVLVAWTRQALDSDWVQDEAEEARVRGVLVPVMLEPVQPPAGFRQLQAADLSQWAGAREHPEFRALVRAVQSLVAMAARDEPSKAGQPVVAQPAALPDTQPLSRLEPEAATPPEPQLAAELEQATSRRRARSMRRRGAYRRAQPAAPGAGLFRLIARPAGHWSLVGAMVMLGIGANGQDKAFSLALLPLALIGVAAGAVARACLNQGLQGALRLAPLAGGLVGLATIALMLTGWGGNDRAPLILAAGLFLTLLGFTLFGALALALGRQGPTTGAQAPAAAPPAEGAVERLFQALARPLVWGLLAVAILLGLVMIAVVEERTSPPVWPFLLVLTAPVAGLVARGFSRRDLGAGPRAIALTGAGLGFGLTLVLLATNPPKAELNEWMIVPVVMIIFTLAGFCLFGLVALVVSLARPSPPKPAADSGVTRG